MGEYTELCINVGIKKDIPDEVIEILKVICGDIVLDDNWKPCVEIPNHQFFKTDRWSRCLRGGSAYFDGTRVSNFVLSSKSNLKKHHNLSVRSDIKNYTSEFELFLNWISKYLVPDTFFVGYLRRPMDNPRLLYFDGNNIVAYSVELGNDKQIMDGKDNE